MIQFQFKFMKIYCTGYKQSEGVFNEKPYNNYLFYFTDLEESGCNGQVPFIRKGKPVTFKIKVSEWDNVYPGEKPMDYVGCQVELDRDWYDNINSMRRL